MPDPRDTELLKYIRAYDQAPPSPPPCQFDHWGLTVFLPPELAKQFEPPADELAFAEFMEQMLPHCRAFMSVCRGTRAEDHEKVFQAFLTPSPNNPIPNFRRYGHKGRAQPYAIWFLKCFCNFLKERYPVSGKGPEVPLLPTRIAVYPFGPPNPPSSSPPMDKVVPFRSDRPNAMPERARPEPPQPSGENPFQPPGEGRPVANLSIELNMSIDDDENSRLQPAIVELNMSVDDDDKPPRVSTVSF
jgi:hypothetical protein